MKIFLITTALFIASVSTVYAHPGNTASDGCHYCRTNCDYWGVPWNVRHCHGGYAPPVIHYSTPTPTPMTIKASMGNDYNGQKDEYSIKFDWEEVQDSLGYSISISKYPGSDPGPLVDTYKSVSRFNHVKKGAWYLNLKSRYINSWSQVISWPISLPNEETRKVK